MKNGDERNSTAEKIEQQLILESGSCREGCEASAGTGTGTFRGSFNLLSVVSWARISFEPTGDYKAPGIVI